MTNPANPSSTGDRNSKTPNTDMQPEDAGTADSGNESRADEGSGARENDPTGAMKQTSKTPEERGSKGER